jgi:hypothetical protein
LTKFSNLLEVEAEEMEMAAVMVKMAMTAEATETVMSGLCGTLQWVTVRTTDELLPLGKFAHDNHVHSLMQQSPFMVDTGRNPCRAFSLGSWG